MLSLLLLSWHPSLPSLSPQDLNQWYQSMYALHGNECLSIVQVQISVGISGLLLAHSESICWAIHCKHHSWSLGTTCYLSCNRKFHDIYKIPCCSANLWNILWLSTLSYQALFHPHMVMEWIKILFALHIGAWETSAHPIFKLFFVVWLL